MMRWGLIPSWAKDTSIGNRIINARAEGIENKPSFHKQIKNQRCLVPANGFYEWKAVSTEKRPEKIPYFISLKRQKIFSFAGIYDTWQDAEGERVTTYCIITTTPNKLIDNIHNRMPAITADIRLSAEDMLQTSLQRR